MIDQDSSLITTAELQQKIGPSETFQDTHERETLRLHPTGLWKGLHSAECSDCSHTHAHWRKATCVPVQWVWKAVFGRTYRMSIIVTRISTDVIYQSSSLARHRRIHSGKRPYMCGHHGCVKT